MARLLRALMELGLELRVPGRRVHATSPPPPPPPHLDLYDLVQALPRPRPRVRSAKIAATCGPIWKLSLARGEVVFRCHDGVQLVGPLGLKRMPLLALCFLPAVCLFSSLLLELRVSVSVFLCAFG